ncbi:hypothetical protein B0H17DRAFT_1060623 [Mycena rosella]|uniref:Nephrocystin 3-like N-terminal domain-containing protein n=1 Tax=Mycena rosella TaxID=1033263 RepID=A0AAD7DJD4_MYCRO|nr:hypothetical protein B0H17DRAFT_1060623 [Mycena rosella]
MSFTISGSDFQGGTFNNVAGDFKIFSSVTLASSAPNPDRDANHQGRESNEYRSRGSMPSAHLAQLPKPHLRKTAIIHSNGTYNTVRGNMSNLSITSYGENGIDVLCRSVAIDALYNSAERPPEPSCHPGTRNSVLDGLHEWALKARPEGSLLWLHGSAGAGKSAIAQTFAADCHERGVLGASFFFQRSNPGRGTWKNVLPTLAYQLAASFPELRTVIQEVVETDRLVVGQAMRLQFQKLIIAPFEHAPALTIRPIIVIDGLDECEDRHAQTMLLKLIIEGLRGGRLPARFVVASRPEPHLREVLEAAENFDICRHLELRPDISAYADIRRYLCDEFSRIREAHTSRGTLLKEDWPGEAAIAHLVKKSSGTFIYASTVLRYVDDEYSHPVERLEAVLRLDPQSTAPLDDLYSQILSSFPNRALLRRVLHAVIRMSVDLDPEEIDVALQLRGGSSRLALRGLHSLLSVPRVRGIGFRRPVALLHASLGDFLVDRARSSGICIATRKLDYDLVHNMIGGISTVTMAPLVFRSIVTSLLHCIVRIPPAEDLLPILRNVDVQQVYYLNAASSSYILDWLKSSPQSPVDLIQIWDDLDFISKLRGPMRRACPVEDSTFDNFYTQILSPNPNLLFTLRISVLWPPRPTLVPVLDVLGLKWDVLRPLCALRPWLESDWAYGESSGLTPIEVLCDPLRSSLMDVPHPEISRYAALLCIARIKEILSPDSLLEFEPTWLLMHMVTQCDPCDAVLSALEAVDFTQLCARLNDDPEYHAECHEDFLHPSTFTKILRWLRVGRNSPMKIHYPDSDCRVFPSHRCALSRLGNGSWLQSRNAGRFSSDSLGWFC